jgi:hypothetical protein
MVWPYLIQLQVNSEGLLLLHRVRSPAASHICSWMGWMDTFSSPRWIKGLGSLQHQCPEQDPGPETGHGTHRGGRGMGEVGGPWVQVVPKALGATVDRGAL